MFKKDLLIRILTVSIATASAVAPIMPAYAAETEETGGEKAEKTEESAGSSTEGLEAEDGGAEKEATAKEGGDAPAQEAPAGTTAEEAVPTEEPGQKQTNPESSMAEALNRQRTMVADDDIMKISIGYQFDDGSFDEWQGGTGFVVGSRYILTRQILADLSTQNSLYSKILSNRGENYKRIGTNLQNEKETQEHMKCFITDINGNDIPINRITVKSGLALIETSKVMDMPAVVFADPKKVSLPAGTIVNAKSAGNAVGKCVVNTFQGTVVVKEGQESGFTFIAEGDSGNAIGAPVYDKNGHILGMVSGDSDGMSCFSIKSLETFLTTNGINFRAIEQIEAENQTYDQETSEQDVKDAEDVVSDKTKLEEAIERAQAVKEKDYTPESYAAMKEAFNEAVRVDANLEATQEQVDSAAAALNEKIDALEPAGFLKTIAGGFMESGFVTALSIILALIASAAVVAVKIVLPNAKGGKGVSIRGALKKKTAGGKKTQKKKDQEEEDNEGLPLAEWDDEDEDMDITIRPKGTAKRLPNDYDPGIEYDEEDESPEVLDDDPEGTGDTVYLKREAYLVREETGKIVPISKNDFLIGKERSKVDYCISGNNTVSRQHCTIKVKSGKYYIEDNDSANYTRVNGKRIRPYANAHIENGDRITISDVDFIFHIK